MASRLLLNPFTHRLPLLSTLGASALLLSPLSPLSPFSSKRIVHHLDSGLSPVSARDWSYSQYEHDAKVPITRNGKLNPRAVRQISAGSILGVVGGLAVSTFSKSLALLIGLLIVGVQTLESRGIHLIPYTRIQRYFTAIDLRSAVQDNAAFKLSFGTTFALTGFADF